MIVSGFPYPSQRGAILYSNPPNFFVLMLVTAMGLLAMELTMASGDPNVSEISFNRALTSLKTEELAPGETLNFAFQIDGMASRANISVEIFGRYRFIEIFQYFQ